MAVAVNIAAGQSKAQTIAALRQAMAAQVAQSGVASGVGGVGATGGPGWSGEPGESDQSGQPGESGESLPVPAELESVLSGVVRRGAVSVIEHPGAVLAGVIAEATKTGYVALVGVGEQGLLSVVEQGGRLDRIVCVPDPGMQPLEVISLLAEGVDLVVTSLARTPTPSQARPLQARLRNFGCALVFVGQQWPGAAATISSSVVGVSGLGRGCGRVRAVDYQVSASGTRFPRRQCAWRVGGAGGVGGSGAGGVVGEGGAAAVEAAAAADNVVAFPSGRRAG